MEKKEVNKRENDKTNLIITIVIILIIIVITVVFLLIRLNRLDPNSDLVTEIYNYMGTNDLETCSGLITYSDNAVEYDDIENEIRICNAYSLLELDRASQLVLDKTEDANTCSINENITFATDNYEDDVCTVTKVASTEINNQYKKMFGQDITDYEQFYYNDNTICYYEDGYYYCGLTESYTTTVGALPHTYRSISSAEKEDDQIIIYDYFLKTIGDECYISYTGSARNEACSENYNADEEMDYDFLKKYGTRYKHTFQKTDNDNYYWVKSEPVEED